MGRRLQAVAARCETTTWSKLDVVRLRGTEAWPSVDDWNGLEGRDPRVTVHRIAVTPTGYARGSNATSSTTMALLRCLRHEPACTRSCCMPVGLARGHVVPVPIADQTACRGCSRG